MSDSSLPPSICPASPDHSHDLEPHTLLSTSAFLLSISGYRLPRCQRLRSPHDSGMPAGSLDCSPWTLKAQFASKRYFWVRSTATSSPPSRPRTASEAPLSSSWSRISWSPKTWQWIWKTSTLPSHSQGPPPSQKPKSWDLWTPSLDLFWLQIQSHHGFQLWLLGHLSFQGGFVSHPVG